MRISDWKRALAPLPRSTSYPKNRAILPAGVPFRALRQCRGILTLPDAGYLRLSGHRPRRADAAAARRAGDAAHLAAPTVPALGSAGGRTAEPVAAGPGTGHFRRQ